MSMITIVVDKDKKPEYKDYVNFLGSYKNGKRDECDNNSVGYSSSSSYRSLSPEASELPTKSFNEYLQTYTKKKFQPVKPAFKENHENKQKNVKTELIIQINSNNEEDSMKNHPHVDDIAKIFEKPAVQNGKFHKIQKKFNVIKGDDDKIITSTTRTNSYDELNNQVKSSVYSNKKTIERLNSEETNQSKSNNSNFAKKTSTINTNFPSSPVINGSQENFIGNNKNVKRAVTRLNSNESPSSLQSKTDSTHQANSVPKKVVSAKIIINGSNLTKNENSGLAYAAKNPEIETPVSALTKKEDETNVPLPPPPPPLPSANFSPKLLVTASPIKTKKTPQYQSNTLPRSLKNNQPLQKDTIDASTLNRNDPKVKKVVYGALRNMYGAYHDKANDYLATLPKNRVKKGNGLDSIIDSIAQSSQFVGTGQGFGPAPPPFIVGHIPPVRLKNHQNIPKKMDPPQCVQNAMMTKDKKPFTYTPGGIDLSEARSPRLQRRIERNANLGGAGDYPQQTPPHPQVTGPLPPSALAAMRPQPQVQVFPSGPPPPAPMRSGIPPPPPAPKQGIPPPPPPPSCPLPTQKVCTSDNQVLERPDMTKIIPDNPMAMLRKTGGPQPRKSLVDQMFEEAGKGATEPKSPPYQQPQLHFQPPPTLQRSQPVTTERGAPISPVPQQTYKQPQQYQQQPQPQYQPPVQQNKQHYSQPVQPTYPEPVKEQPRYQPPIIERQPTAPQNRNIQPEVKTSTAHLGSLYIPPVNQQQQNQKKIVSPPTPPERNLDSHTVQTPPLREAPRPWQAKKPQEEVPAWAKRDNQISNNVEEFSKPSPPASQPQQKWPQSRQNEQPSYNQPQPQYVQPQYQTQPQYQQQPQYRQEQGQNQQQPIGVRIEIRTKPQPHQYQNEAADPKPNAVYVTQPVVLQHPGGAGPQPGRQPQGPRVIPIQIESPRSPAGNERVLNRQQSWGNNPSQSNSFKIIQKITNTDAEDDYENIPVTEHSPKFPQNFQQDLNFQDEENPRYRGGHIPSKVFRLLDESVSRGPMSPPQKGPQVRTIPIQIEGDDRPKQYVHPSEQVVPEPKKYTGSSIPSRSFKILQAMTAPDNNCAIVDDQNEEFPYDEWVYPPHYPPYPYPPYWYEYYHYYYPENYPEEATNKKSSPSPRSVSRSTSPAASGRHTPVPFWGYPPQYYPPPKVSEKGRHTPISSSSTNTEPDGNESDYCPYYDPYYYHYYYGYPHPPIYPRYSYYPSDNEGSANGYSSADEKSKINKKVLEPQPKRLSRQTPERSVVGRMTPTLNVKEVVVTPPKEEKIESSECETDTETDDEYSNHLLINPLKSMKSITNIDTYNSSDEDTSKEEGIVEEYSDDSNEDVDDTSSMGYEDDQYPHQLSVIQEESERTESRIRTVSVLSDSTTLAEKSEAEYDDEDEEEDVSLVENNESEEELPADIKSECPSKVFDAEVCIENKREEMPEKVIESTENINEDDDKRSDESEDWWGILGKEDDDFPKPRKTQPVIEEEMESSDNNEENLSSSTTIVEEKTHLDNLGNGVIQCKKENIENSDGIRNELLKKYNNSETNIVLQCKEANTEYSDDMRGELLKNKNNSETNIVIQCKEGNTENSDDISELLKSENNSEINAINPEEPIEYKVVLRRKKSANTPETETKPRPRSIYDSLEDIKTESSGNLIKVDNFVGILEQIQKDFGCFLNSRSQSDSDKVKNGNINRPVSMYEMSEPNEEKPNDAKEKRFSYSSFEEFTARQETIFEENSSSDDDKSNHFSNDYNRNQTIQLVYNTENGSSNYNKYNSSMSANSVYTDEVNTEVNICDNKSSNESSNRSEMEESCEETDASCSEKDEKENFLQLPNESDMKVPSIKDRIQALRESISSKRNRNTEQDGKVPTMDKISISESRSKPTSSKSSFKSFEESEEDEVDSGVTSDMSRHISDTEEFVELRKLTKYQRAATHSRLFKLLQEECNEESDEAENIPVFQREGLSLHLNETTDIKGTVNDKLVNELIDSLLKLKKGQAFRNLPKEKLYAAAVKILQEDIDIADTTTEDLNSFLSPLRPSTGYSTAVQTPQEFGNNFDDYKQYYESWNRDEENYEIFPSKAFKGLQSGISGTLGKCPRVISSKNIHKKLIKLLETSENPSPIPDKPPLETNEVTSVS